MNEKPMAGILTAVVVAPVVALCCLGSAVIGSVIAGLIGWLSGFGVLLAIAAAVGAGALGYSIFRWRSVWHRRDIGAARGEYAQDAPVYRPGA